jgi:integrase
VSAERFQELIADERIPVEHRALWALLWEGELRLDDLLSIDVRDVDFEAHTIRAEHPAKAEGVAVVPFGARAGSLLWLAVGDSDAGPAIHRAGRPVSREAAMRVAQAAGVSVHGFRLGGQWQRRAG